MAGDGTSVETKGSTSSPSGVTAARDERCALPYRVIQWGVGLNRQALVRAIARHPDLVEIRRLS